MRSFALSFFLAIAVCAASTIAREENPEAPCHHHLPCEPEPQPRLHRRLQLSHASSNAELAAQAASISSNNKLHRRRSLQQEGQPDAAEGDNHSRVDRRFAHHDPFTRRVDRMMGGWSSQAAAATTAVRPSSSSPQQAVVATPTTISSNTPTTLSAVTAEQGPQHE